MCGIFGAIDLPGFFDGWTKYVLRRSLPELPDAVRWRRDKQGFVTPEALWLRKHFRELSEGTSRSSRLAQLGIVDDKSFMEQYRKFQSGSIVVSH